MNLNFSENLKRLRKEKGVTQEKLSEIVGVSAQSVSRWELSICYPDIEMLPGIANYFGVTVDELLGRPPADEKMVPRTLEARIISGGVDQLPKDERDRILSVLQAMYSNYPDLFDYEKGEDNEP